MTTFYAINKIGGNQKTIGFLKTACWELKIKFVEVYTNNFSKVKVKKDDLLYGVSNDYNAKVIQKILVERFDPKTFYKNKAISDVALALENVVDSTLVHSENNIPMPKTSFVNTDDGKILKDIARELNSFPIIIKEAETEHGLGIRKANNLGELAKICRELISAQRRYILREYINTPGISYRAIVLGGKIICNYKTKSFLKGDFRSNTGREKCRRTLCEIKGKNKKILAKSVDVLGLEFGGVDYTYDKSGTLKIFEVNFPCNIAPILDSFNINIAKEMILYLNKK